MLSIKALRYPESPIEKNSTTILQVCISLLLSGTKRNTCRGVATRRDPIHVETGEGRKEPKIIRWGKVGAVEDGNSEVKDGTNTVELQSHEKIRCGVPSPRYSPHAPLPTL